MVLTSLRRSLFHRLIILVRIIIIYISLRLGKHTWCRLGSFLGLVSLMLRSEPWYLRLLLVDLRFNTTRWRRLIGSTFSISWIIVINLLFLNNWSARFRSIVLLWLRKHLPFCLFSLTAISASFTIRILFMRRYLPALHLLVLVLFREVLHCFINIWTLFIEHLLLLLCCPIHSVLSLFSVCRLLMRKVNLWLRAAFLRLYSLIRFVSALLFHLLVILLGLFGDCRSWNGCLFRKPGLSEIIWLLSGVFGMHSWGLHWSVRSLARFWVYLANLLLHCFFSFFTLGSASFLMLRYITALSRLWPAILITIFLFKRQFRGGLIRRCDNLLLPLWLRWDVRRRSAVLLQVWTVGPSIRSGCRIATSCFGFTLSTTWSGRAHIWCWTFQLVNRFIH